MKYGLNFKLFVETYQNLQQKNGVYIQQATTIIDTIQIPYPFTIDFDINKTAGYTLNNATFHIKNLSSKTRADIFQDKFNLISFNGSSQQNLYKTIIFQAGYTNLTEIFYGDMLEGFSERQGTEYNTFISARESLVGVLNGTCNFTVAEGTTQDNILTAFLNTMPNVERGAIRDLGPPIPRARSFTGNTYAIMKEYYGPDSVSFEGNKLNILAVNDYIDGVNLINLINTDSGLLATPKRNDAYLTVDIIFEPTIVIGQLIEIQSQLNPLFNGTYKVFGIKHSGTISGAVSAQCKTTLQLMIGTKLFNPIKLTQPTQTNAPA